MAPRTYGKICLNSAKKIEKKMWRKKTWCNGIHPQQWMKQVLFHKGHQKEQKICLSPIILEWHTTVGEKESIRIPWIDWEIKNNEEKTSFVSGGWFGFFKSSSIARISDNFCDEFQKFAAIPLSFNEATGENEKKWKIFNLTWSQNKKNPK